MPGSLLSSTKRRRRRMNPTAANFLVSQTQETNQLMYPRVERLLYQRQQPSIRQTRYWQSGSQCIHRKRKVYTDGNICMLTTAKMNIHLENLGSKHGMATLRSVHRYTAIPVGLIHLSMR
ncbi:hypothetical protein CTA2_9861 [Colletotrichum tanaceti]|uniref:Uncharacterized protein n=1 Tax=Colletotrichum tanaceti TaxID=1306861 RepID=A0A4U6XC60_9PEZI|nr:hypothetical protein CTA2_9861 [Colletotrichum tanaceti]TKW51347.1 hypothetical protein CTA1_5658 [Colletotrichum tanaceti]